MANGTKKSTTVSSAANMTEYKPKTKSEYVDLKRRLLGWERDNYSSLAVITGTNGMHKMFDHSAVIFSCQVAKKLGISDTPLINDSDFGFPTDKPVCLLWQYNNIRKALLSAGMKERAWADGVTIFELGYTLTEADLDELEKEQQTLIDRANELVLPSNVYPRLRTELLNLTKLVNEMTRKMNPVHREVVGARMLQILIFQNVDFISMANGQVGQSAYFKKLRKDLIVVNGMLDTMMNLRMYDLDKIFRVVQQTNVVQNKLSGAMEQARAKMKESELISDTASNI